MRAATGMQPPRVYIPSPPPYFGVWAQLACRAAETLFISAEVIQARMFRFASAPLPLGARDKRELRTLSDEKVRAYTQAAFAMGVATATAQQRYALDVARLLASPAMYTTPLNLWMRALQLPADMTAASARVTHRGLTPVRARAARNAKRLRGAR